MKLATAIVAVTGLASLTSAIPIRIIHIDAIAPLSHEIDVGPITRTPAQADTGSRDSSSWWNQFTEKYALHPADAQRPPRPGHSYKWHPSHPRLGEHDHSTPGTDASLVPSWMYETPLSSARYAPVVAAPGSAMGGRVVKVVTGPDGAIQVVEVDGNAHGGIGCVFTSMKRMIHSLSLHQLVIFSATTLLMLLVILRLGFATVLLLRRAHAYANECPGAEASRRRELRPREEEGGGLPAYSVVEDGDEKNALLPAYEERS